MDTKALKIAALLLREKLELYKHKDPAVAILLSSLYELLYLAESEKIQESMEARDIPGYRLFTETNLQAYSDLEAAYTSFYIELIGGREWDAYKLIKARMTKP